MPHASSRTCLAYFLLFLCAFLGTGCAGSGNSGQGASPVTSSPSVTSLSPSSLPAGSGDTLITLKGSQFSPASQVQAGGAALVTTYISSSELVALISAAQLTTAGVVALTVANGGSTSSAASLSVTNPAPVITALTPSSLPPGPVSAVVTVQGTGFVAGSVVQVNGAGRATVVNSATQLTTTLGSADLANPGTLLVNVVNAAPGGGASAPSTLNVDASSNTPVPTLTDRFPATLETAAPTTTFYATGTNFTPGCKVLWNGQAFDATLTKTSQSLPPQLLLQLPPSAIPVAGTYTVAVACAEATTASLTVAVIDPPAPQILTYTSAAIPVRTDTTFTITGTDFTSRSVAQFNGAAIATTVVDNEHLSVTVSAAEIQVPGQYPLEVVTAGPGGGSSRTFGLTGFIALPNNDMVFNPGDGMVYVSTPASAPYPYPSTIVPVNPATGEIAPPFSTLSGPTKLALSADNKDLWVAEEDNYQIAEIDMGTRQIVYTNVFSTHGGLAVTAMSAVPGVHSAVALATYSPDYGATLQIADPSFVLASTIVPPRAIDSLQVNGTTNEIYALAGDTYLVYTYGASGLALKTSMQLVQGAELYSSLEIPASSQLAGGLLYTGTGAVLNPETGESAGGPFVGPGLSDSGSGDAYGPVFADVTLGKVFFVPGPGYGQGAIYVFKLADDSFITNDISVSLAGRPGASQTDAYPSDLYRWGANGLVFRNQSGVYSLRSPLIAGNLRP